MSVIGETQKKTIWIKAGINIKGYRQQTFGGRDFIKQTSCNR